MKWHMLAAAVIACIALGFAIAAFSIAIAATCR